MRRVHRSRSPGP
ncbi:hypothetical protein EYF80_067080 [Liparis tanakae]|uniref:Uncharacterized protein n=1 Tax=Liparis tanakae TaxID=230148 RepID=A0A4Z2E206_9TELE|nr:hypothetical protein EYF80_067080 [Liparis tanakae]